MESGQGQVSHLPPLSMQVYSRHEQHLFKSPMLEDVPQSDSEMTTSSSSEKYCVHKSTEKGDRSYLLADTFIVFKYMYLFIYVKERGGGSE